MDYFDNFESEENLGDESFTEFEIVRRPKKGQARRRYDRLMEDKRLKQQLEDDIAYW